MIRRVLISQRSRRWALFLIGGGVNTGVTYGAYLALKLILSYQVAYMLAYALGIVISYLFNALIVFKAPIAFKSIVAYPIFYIAQYAISAVSLRILVDLFLISTVIAPLVVTVVMLPITYIVIKFILNRRHVT